MEAAVPHHTDVAESLRDLGNVEEAMVVENVGAVADALFDYLTHEPDPWTKWAGVLLALDDAGYDLPKKYAEKAEAERKRLVDEALAQAGQGEQSEGGEE